MINQEKNIIKRNDFQFIFSYLTREFNNLADGDKLTKKTSIENLHTFLVMERPSIKSELIQEILIAFNKNLLKIALFDTIDKCRELSLKVLIYLYSNCTHLSKFLPFIFSALVDKLECSDIEGVSELPEDIRPTPSQKPHKVSKLTEPVEEIRILYVKLLEAVTLTNETSDKDDFRLFVNDIVNITRMLAMDPCHSVVLEACNYIAQLALRFNKDLLFYFNSIISRSLFYALTHKQAKLRIAALEALDKLMLCSPFKKNMEIIEQLIGFRDPNLIPIKDFYEPSQKLNYLAMLIVDPINSVVKKFYEVVTNWLINGEDRFDLESRIIPYVLTGLFDSNDEIALYVYDRLNMIGERYEIDNEKEIREERQLGVDSPWVKYCTEDKYPFPLGKRPRLGCRLIVRKYLRRYIKGLCKEFDGIDESIKVKVSNLVLFSVIYSEEIIVEYLDQVFLCFQKELVKGTKGDIIGRISRTLNFIGRFCDYDSITKLIYPTIEGDLNGNYPDMQRGGLICLKFIFQGHIDALRSPSFGFGMFEGKLKEMLSTLNSSKFLLGLDHRTAIDLIDFYLMFTSTIRSNLSMIKDSIDQFVECLDMMFSHLVECLGVIDLNSNEVLRMIETNLNSINHNVNEILNEKENRNFFSYKSDETLMKISAHLDNHFISALDKNFKIFYIFLKSKMFSNFEEVKLQLILGIFQKIFLHDENHNVHLESVRLLVNFLSSNDSEGKVAFLNEKLIVQMSPSLVSIFNNIFMEYSKIEDEKFKYADLLKDQKELEKKRLKSSKALKSELRFMGLHLIKNILTQNNLFSLKATSDLKSSHVVLKELMRIFNDKVNMTNFSHENEANRKFFIELYHQFLVKFLSIIQISKEEVKPITLNFEEYFLEEVYDPLIDIRQMSMTVLNLIFSTIPISQFYKPMCSLFENGKENFNMESFKALAYMEDETKLVAEYFSNMKSIFSVIINLYLDEKAKFGSQCEQAMKLIIQRFPIYTFNELIKANKKNQVTRVEFLDRMLKKFLK